MRMVEQDARPVVVTGANGQLGRELCLRLGTAAVPLPRSALDVTKASEVRDVLAGLSPATVINCAAWTAVDAAESHRDECFAANAGAVAAIAAACAAIDATLVQVSTDYVFGSDADRRRPYREDDVPGPVSVYGESKLAGEAAARSCPRHLIVRTCGLYSVPGGRPVRGRCFADTMLALSGERERLQVVADQHCTPSFVPHVAEAILLLAARGATGLFHVTNSGSTTWHGFARAVLGAAGVSIPVDPIPTSAYPLPAARPAFSVLDTSRLKSVGIEMPDWRDGVAEYAAGLRSESSVVEGFSCVQSS